MGMNFGKIIVLNSDTKKSSLEILNSIVPSTLNKANGYIDTRIDGNIAFSKFKNGIIEIANSDIAESIFRNHDSDIIVKLYENLNHPKTILILQYYDFNNTFGYIVIENGVVIRKRRSSAGTLLENFGDILECETLLKDSTKIQAIYNEELGELEELNDDNEEFDEEEIENAYQLKGGEILSESDLSLRLLDSIMINYLGENSWDWMPEIEINESFTFKDDLIALLNL
ncbi:hypothetical protein [Emticicia oligotrophica]|uniref:hypothetical protein n=1 Tax=Emticicia oligotrophica TaxID=312279 RepID=UPI00273C977F|nr:hypothetical protein [Emticicia oligotrophica]